MQRKLIYTEGTDAQSIWDVAARLRREDQRTIDLNLATFQDLARLILGYVSYSYGSGHTLIADRHVLSSSSREHNQGYLEEYGRRLDKHVKHTRSFLNDSVSLSLTKVSLLMLWRNGETKTGQQESQQNSTKILESPSDRYDRGWPILARAPRIPILYWAARCAGGPCNSTRRRGFV